MKTPLFTLFSLLIFGTAHAARLAPLETPTSALRFYQVSARQYCEATSSWGFNCEVKTFKIVSKKRDEKLVNTVKQALYIAGEGYIEEVNAQLLSHKNTRKGVFEAFYRVMESSGLTDQARIDATSAVLGAEDVLLEGLLNDVENKEWSFIGGHASGAFSLEDDFLAIIDRKAGEMLIFSAGVSE